MEKLKIGDLVARKSYNGDILFKIVDIIKRPNKPNLVILKGVSLRIVADSPEEDLYRIDSNEVNEFQDVYNKKINKTVNRILQQRKEKKTVSSYLTRTVSRSIIGDLHFGRPGKVLHLDGDGEYLDLCLRTYSRLEIHAVGKKVPEREQPIIVKDLLMEYVPDLLVITGHDGLLKGYRDFTDIHNYRNSAYFVEAVKEARKYEPNIDELVIFAGACQSHYEALLDAGANFASSPHRVLIHCLDPVFICEKIAYTSVDRFIPIDEILENTITGVQGVGGLQTRGKYRHGLPKSPYQ
jgi:spore coat assembly protein